MNEDLAREALTRIADALERNTAALQAILQRLAEPTVLPLIESTPDAEPEPEPETKPTAAEVLEAAWLKADDGSAHKSILGAALRYAQTAPKWFSDWHTFSWPDSALIKAAFEAGEYHDYPAEHLLTAAACVASDQRHLFGGAK